MTRPILHRQSGSWTNIASYPVDDRPDLYASLAAVTLPYPNRAMPSARAATPSGPSLLHVSGVAGIAIAAFVLLYFGGELLRAVLS